VTPNAAPTNAGVAPASAADPAGTFRSFVASYNDPDGALNFYYAYLSINSNDPARRLQAVYNLLNNRLYLLADDGVSLLGGFAPGSANVISNSRGSLNCAGTSISLAGTRMSVNWNVSATPALTGQNTVWLRSRDRGGLDTGFVLQSGVTWNVT
jgi:hypothetical protein